MDACTVPQFQMHHRLALALEAAGVTPPQMARALGLAKNTVYAYMAGTRHPKLGMVKQWALVCQVPWEWLLTGELPPDGPSAIIGTTTGRKRRGSWRGNRPHVAVLTPSVKVAA